MSFQTTVEMRTEKGPVREKNEDSVGLLQASETRPGTDALYVVADGLGGHENGEVASAMAVDLLLKSYGINGTDKTPPSAAALEPSLVQTLRDISEAIYSVGASGEAMHRDPYRAGMATTVTAALLAGDILYLGHVGDCRAYILRQGRLTQMTEDHTLLADQVRRGILSPAEARNYPSNALTQAVGLEYPITPFTRSIPLEEGDYLLLCSDGLHSFLDDPAIAETIQREQGEGAVNSLISQAIARGSNDNITALLVSFAGPEDQSQVR